MDGRITSLLAATIFNASSIVGCVYTYISGRQEVRGAVKAGLDGNSRSVSWYTLEQEQFEA